MPKVKMVKYLLLIILIINYIECIEYINKTRCSSNCEFYQVRNEVGNCRQNRNCALPQNCECQPEGHGRCINSCKLNGGNRCVAKEQYMESNSSYITPSFCNYRNGYFEGVECNPTGKGIYCPYGCHYDQNKCLSNDPNILCGPKINYICPTNCRYDKMMKKCKPLVNSVICEFDEITHECPYNCNYDYVAKKCLSSIRNFVCGKIEIVDCPEGCINLQNDCLPRIVNTTICKYVEEPQCPRTCYFNTTSGYCHSSNPFYSVCEPTVIKRCEYLYELSKDERILDISNCTPNNSIDLCRRYDGSYQYPVRLEDKYRNVKCQYPIKIEENNCQWRPISPSGCPIGCNYDPYSSRCISPHNYLCGDMAIHCPIINGIELCSMYSDINEMTCRENYILLSIKDERNREIIRCGPKWYYG